MALVKQRIGAFRTEIIDILRDEQSLQIRRIVNRMRPGVACQERKIIGKATLEFDVQRVVIRITVGNLRVDRTERRNDARCSTSECLG